MGTIDALDDRTLFTLMAVVQELHRAQEKYDNMGIDMVHAAAVVAEESGELVRAALQHYYDRAPVDAVVTEATQTAAMGIRFILEYNK